MTDYWDLRREEEDGEFWRNPDDDWSWETFDDPEEPDVLAAEVSAKPPGDELPYGAAAFRGILWGCLLTVGMFTIMGAAIYVGFMLLT